MVKSHDEREVAYFAVGHVKSAHQKDITLDDAKTLMTDA